MIEASVVGAALISGANKKQIADLSTFSSQLGIAFQIKDDLLDGLDSNQDHKNYIQILGEEKTQQELKNKTEIALQALKKVDVSVLGLEKVLQYNVNRIK